MKSLIKKLAAVLIAVATTLGFAGLGALTATAADAKTGSITVNTIKGFAGDLTYYQMFSAEVSTETADNSAVTYTLKDEWKTFFTSSSADAAGTKFSASDELSTKAVDYIKGLKEAQRADFANKAAAWASTQNITGQTAPKGTDAKAPIKINDLEFGYYLIVPATAHDGQLGQEEATENTRHQSLLVSVTESESDVSVSLKYETPSIDKTVQKKDSTEDPVKGTDVNVGDTVTYTLTSKVPNTEGYKTYVFNIHDKLSEGLTLASKIVDDDETFFNPTVKITTIVNGRDVTISPAYKTEFDDNNGQGPTNVSVIFADITQYRAYTGSYTYKDDQGNDKTETPKAPIDLTGATITVTYDATLNDKAVAGIDPNTNQATVEYTNDPYTGGTGTSIPSEADVYDFQFTLDKYLLKDGEKYGQDSTHLSGAEFQVFPNTTDNKPGTTAMKFTETPAVDGKASATYAYDSEKATSTDRDVLDKLTDTLTSPISGKILVKGLAAGTYWVKETKAPAGYNKLENYIKVTISADIDATTGKVTNLTTKYVEYNKDEDKEVTTNDFIAGATGDSGNPIIPVGNKKGSVLPSTGGMGTILFTVIGVLVVALGTVWYVKSGRKDSAK